MKNILIWLFNILLLGILFVAISVMLIYYYYGAGLPDYKTLSSYEPPVVSRVYANDGRLFAEYSNENRIYVPYTAIPDHVKKAFIAAEDKNFYDHFGVDF